MVDRLRGEGVLQHDVGLGEAGVDVAGLVMEVADDVAVRVELNRVRREGSFGRHDRVERLVLHLDEQAGGVGFGGALGRDGDDRLAGETDTVPGEDGRVLGQRPDEQPIRRDVRRGEHGAHPGGVPGLRQVDVQDSCMRVLASHEAAVEHPFGGEVGRVAGAATDLVQRVVAGEPHADPGTVALDRVAFVPRSALGGFADQPVILVLPVFLLFERSEGELLALGLRPAHRHPSTPAPRTAAIVGRYAQGRCRRRIAELASFDAAKGVHAEGDDRLAALLASLLASRRSRPGSSSGV